MTLEEELNAIRGICLQDENNTTSTVQSTLVSSYPSTLHLVRALYESRNTARKCASDNHNEMEHYKALAERSDRIVDALTAKILDDG